MKIKMFLFKDPEKAEESIHSWLQSSNAKIDHITQSQSEKNGRFLLVVSIFYHHQNE